jgi:hypothetical protein
LGQMPASHLNDGIYTPFTYKHSQKKKISKQKMNY